MHIDIRPLWQRLDLIAVRNVLVITKDWAEEAIERGRAQWAIEHHGLERTLFEGVEIRMVEAPGKDLTYHLVNETVTRLLAWEMTRGKGRAVEFGILKQAVLKGAGSIRKGKIRSLDVVR